jgi:MerR family transcriptional regulator, mercuric resistance operon regulatory protein
MLDPGIGSRVYGIGMGRETTAEGLRPGQLADMAGVSTDTLRHYERKGLLSAARSANGYREYPPYALARVRLVQHALAVGFTLDELASFLRIRDRGDAPCRQVRALAARKLEELEARIRGLLQLQTEMWAMLADWDARLAGAGDGRKVWLLETLAFGGPSRRENRPGVRGSRTQGGRK